MPDEQLISEGVALRAVIREHILRTNMSARKLSREIGRHPNYITSFLSRGVEDWAVPKEPTHSKLKVILGAKAAAK